MACMIMELRDIEYFAVVAEHGHLGRAAEALGLGQPALSMSLRRLERLAQAKLVIRTARGVELTAMGRTLLSHLGRLRLARDDLVRELADLAQGRAGHLRIGVSPSNAELFLPEACGVLLSEGQGVSLDVTLLDNTALLPALAKGDLDLALRHTTLPPPPDVIDELFREDQFVIYCAASHRLARRKSVSLEDIARERWTATSSAAGPLFALPEAFARAGLQPPRTVLVSDLMMLKLRVVAGSDLLGIANRKAVLGVARRLSLVILPVKGLDMVRRVAVSYRRDAYLPAAARRLIDILKTSAHKPGSVDA
jgi:DNA-binding transcriptional LysR family regulator